MCSEFSNSWLLGWGGWCPAIIGRLVNHGRRFPPLFEESCRHSFHFSGNLVRKVPFSRKMVAVSEVLSLKRPDFRRKSSKMTCSVAIRHCFRMGLPGKWRISAQNRQNWPLKRHKEISKMAIQRFLSGKTTFLRKVTRQYSLPVRENTVSSEGRPAWHHKDPARQEKKRPPTPSPLHLCGR